MDEDGAVVARIGGQVEGCRVAVPRGLERGAQGVDDGRVDEFAVDASPEGVEPVTGFWR